MKALIQERASMPSLLNMHCWRRNESAGWRFQNRRIPQGLNPEAFLWVVLWPD